MLSDQNPRAGGSGVVWRGGVRGVLLMAVTWNDWKEEENEGLVLPAFSPALGLRSGVVGWFGR